MLPPLRADLSGFRQTGLCFIAPSVSLGSENGVRYL